MRMVFLAALATLLPSSVLAQDGLELDLSAPSDLESVAVLPPVVKVTAKQGDFVGFQAKKTTAKWDVQAHERLVDALTRALKGKVVPAQATVGALAKAGVGPAQAHLPASLAKVARALNVAWIVVFEAGAKDAIRAQVVDYEGQPAGEALTFLQEAGFKQASVDAMAAALASKIAALAQERMKARAAAAPPPVEQVVDRDIPPPVPEVSQPAPSRFRPQPHAPRLTVAVGPGLVTRSLSVGGEASADLARLESGTVVGLGVALHWAPLHFFEALRESRWADLEAEFHYRRSFARAAGVAGGVEGQACAMTEDDLQVRGTWRIRLGGHPYLPRLGVGAGFSQEQTRFSCDLPLVSAVYRGADVQLRARQPLWREVVALDVAAGPRFLFGGPDATPGFSLAGEAWLEVRPWGFSFARGGARLSRLALSRAGLDVVDTRGFFALEVGAFF